MAPESVVPESDADLKVAFLAETDLDQRWDLLAELHGRGWAFRPFNHDEPFARRRDWAVDGVVAPSGEPS